MVMESNSTWLIDYDNYERCRARMKLTVVDCARAVAAKRGRMIE